MSSQELKRRISELHRGPADGRALAAAARSSAPRRIQPDEYLSNAEVLETARGSVLVSQARLADVYPESSRLVRGYLAAFPRAAQLAGEDTLPRFLEPLASADPARTALIDTETTGFHGRPLFMIGMARYQDGDLLLSQYFARTYPEEVGLLHEFAGMLPDIHLLISFNGKAFDWPFVRDRMVYHRLSCDQTFAHLDLLHPSRRRWRDHLPNCRLQTLERYLCGRWRSGDIPGDQIPQRYHDFVREQDASMVAPIFHHNRLDLITMVELLVALVDGEESTRSAPPTDDGSTAAHAARESRGRKKGACRV